MDVGTSSKRVPLGSAEAGWVERMAAISGVVVLSSIQWSASVGTLVTCTQAMRIDRS